MTKDINKSKFSNTTILKLNIFREYFNEWFPVFTQLDSLDSVHIFDFFAANGKDIEGNWGSPLILLDAARGKDQCFCKNIISPTFFIFNEKVKKKKNELARNIKSFTSECQESYCNSKCVFQTEVLNFSFHDLYSSTSIQAKLKSENTACLVIIDQNGIKEVTGSIFRELISYPLTDFIFFISSQSIKRFPNHPNIKKYFDTERIIFDPSKPQDCHRAISNYYKSLIPDDMEYYLHHFSIKKEVSGNYYGLIFGSSHTLGAEKFMKVCWDHDKVSGESNHNIDNDYHALPLFSGGPSSKKKERVKRAIKREILNKTLSDNRTGLKYALQYGCRPKVFSEVVTELVKNDRITIIGNDNRQSTKIHSVPKYWIKVK